MLLKFIISAFKMEEDNKETKNRNPYASHLSSSSSSSSSSSYNKSSNLIVGLKILVQISQGKSNFLVQPALGSKRSSAAFRRSSSSSAAAAASDQNYSCFLKTCHLCNKKLSLDKDIFMYRGDQGFCSVDCRDRQIYLDEMKELEDSTRQILKSNNYRHCFDNDGAADRRETQSILEELRRERLHYNGNNNSQKIHWAIAS